MAMNDTEIISSLKKIVDSVGVGAFANHARANALVSDYFPGNDNAKTRKLIKSIIDVDAFAKISAASNSDLDGVCKAVKTLLVDDESLSEDRAEMAVGWVCGALGKRKPNFPKPVQPKPQLTQTTSSGSSSSYSGQTSNSSYTPSRQPTQQPRTVNTPSNNTYGLNLNHHVKRKKKVPKKLIGWTITLCVLVALAYFVVWPKMIYPNMANEELYTPEIIQTYSGTYNTGKVEGNAVVTITSCDQSGNLTGFLEFIVGNTYGKYEVAGKITEKKNNGNLVLTLTPGQWVIQPDNYTPLETMTVEITDGYQSFECSQYSMYWSIGGNDEYSIKTVDDLQKLVGSEATYQLKNDIDLSGVNWTPIEGFKGTFMGNGYTIKNLKIETSASNVGFFSTLTGTVANLNFENAEIKVTGYQKNIGILCGTLEGSASSIKVSGSVIADSSENVGGIAGSISKLGDFSIGTLNNVADVTGNERVGGIAGYFGGSWNSSYSTRTLQINSVSNAGKISGHGNYVGGIFGELYCNNTGSSQLVQIYDVNNKGDVSGLTYVGGIFGNAYSNNSSSFVDRAVSSGSISAEAMVGCIAGKTSNITLNNCTNEGSKLVATKYITEDGKKLAYVGGIVGHGYMVNDSINSVAIEYKSEGDFVGGIAGKLSVLGNVGLKNLKNNANISGKEHVGGISGYFGGSWNESYSQRTMTINTFVNTGNIVAEGNYSGGIFGELYCNNTGASQVVQMYDTENQGDVSGKLYVGGIFGNAYTNSSASILDRATSSSKVAAEAIVGCIAGKASNIVFNNCTNEGSALTATKYITEDGKKLAYVGGIVGYGYIVNNSTNSVNIAYTSEGHYVGGIAGRLSVLGNVGVENLENKANIQGKEYVGGIAGSFGGSWNESYSQRTLTINSLKNSGNILASGSYVGGIFGELYCNNTGASQVVQIYDSENFGDVSGKTYVGGIFGNAYTNSDASMIDRAVCKGNISAEAMVGCIVGKASGLVLNNCSNEGSTLSATKYITEEGKKKAYVGGIVGLGYIVNNSVNSVTIDYKSEGQYVGGIAGYLSALGNVNMENLENKANVTGYEHVGGIAGFFGGSWNASYSQRTIKINNMQNGGAIKATNGYVGGIFGELYCKNTGSSQVVQVYDSVNSGSVSGGSYVGGIFGNAYTNSSASFMMGCSTITGSLAGKAENMSEK